MSDTRHADNRARVTTAVRNGDLKAAPGIREWVDDGTPHGPDVWAANLVAYRQRQHSGCCPHHPDVTMKADGCYRCHRDSRAQTKSKHTPKMEKTLGGVTRAAFVARQKVVKNGRRAPSRTPAAPLGMRRHSWKQRVDRAADELTAAVRAVAAFQRHADVWCLCGTAHGTGMRCGGYPQAARRPKPEDNVIAVDFVPQQMEAAA